MNDEQNSLVPSDDSLCFDIPYDEQKRIPFWTLPILKTILFFKDKARNFACFISPHHSPSDTVFLIRQAAAERNIINNIKLQRHITKLNEVIVKAIRDNKEDVIYYVGSYSSNNIILANSLVRHLYKSGLKCAEQTINQIEGSIWITAMVPYE